MFSQTFESWHWSKLAPSFSFINWQRIRSMASPRCQDCWSRNIFGRSHFDLPVVSEDVTSKYHSCRFISPLITKIRAWYGNHMHPPQFKRVSLDLLRKNVWSQPRIIVNSTKSQQKKQHLLSTKLASEIGSLNMSKHMTFIYLLKFQKTVWTIKTIWFLVGSVPSRH